MTTLIIADAHVGQGRDDARAMTSLVQRAVEHGVGEVVYLGDVFQYLIGMSKFWTPSIRRVMEGWRAARSRGLRIGIVEGNRDFFLDDPELAAEIDWSAREYLVTSGTRRFLLVHGDLVNPRDFQYRFWSKISKSSIARLWAHLLPRRIAVAIVRRMELHLATTNRKFRYTRPIADLTRSSEKAWAEGVDVVFWGHFHTPWRCRNKIHEALIIPAWLEHRTSVLVDDDGGWAVVDDRLQPVALEIDDLSEDEKRILALETQ